jgi:O-antigen/teichoic acid export membrane protein
MHIPFTLRGASAAVLGLIGTQAATFLIEAVVARRLGASGIGTLAIGTSLAATFGATIVSGCASAASAQVAKSDELGGASTVRGHLGLAVRLAVVAASAIGALLVVFADPIASVLAPGDNTVRVIRLFAVALPFQAAGGVGIGVALALGKPAAEVTYRWTDALVRALSVPAMFILGADVTAVAAIHLAASIASAPIGLRAAFLAAGPATGQLGEELSDFLSLAGWQTVATAAWLAARRADVLVVSAILGPSAAGAYRLAGLLASLAGLVMLALQPVFFPVAARRLAAGGQEGLGDHYRRVTRFASLVTAPVAATLIAVNQPLVSFFGAPFAGAKGALVVLAFAQVILAAGGHSTTLVQIAGLRARAALNALAGASIQMLALLVFAAPLGVTGAAVATAIGILFTHTLQLRSAWMAARIAPFDSGWGRAITLVAALMIVAGVTAAVAPSSVLIATAILASGLTAYTFLALRFVLPVGDRRLLAGMFGLRRESAATR